MKTKTHSPRSRQRANALRGKARKLRTRARAEASYGRTVNAARLRDHATGHEYQAEMMDDAADDRDEQLTSAPLIRRDLAQDQDFDLKHYDGAA